jgi:signal transduction histidine kinase
MILRKVENNIIRFEKRISNAIFALLSVALAITTVLFCIISYQNILHQKSLQSKDIDNAISLFQYNLSEKLSIIASSSVFIDFLTSGNSTRDELEPQFLTELLPLRSSGIVGYSLVNTETEKNYKSGDETNNSITIKLCYLANKLDSENGNCYGSLKLFFSEQKIINEFTRINNSIIHCLHCKKYNLIKNGYFGNFIVENQSQFGINITTEAKSEKIFYYYLAIIIILFSFSMFNRFKLRNMINETISNPLDSLVKRIKNHEPMPNNPNALQEINYLSTQIEEGRLKISKINQYEKKAALGHLAAEVAHDIRSPLAVMDITISTILKNIPTLQLAILNQAVQSVRDIANNLLEHHRNYSPSRLNNNNSNVLSDDGNIPRHVLLSSILDLLTSQKRHEWQNNPCELHLTISPESKSKWIHAAPNDIKRVISNLLNNSYEALENIRIIKIFLKLIDNYIEITITDSGIGIPQKQIEHVLNGGSLKHPGEGLGLCEAKKYMHSINGRLTLESLENKGTSIILLFPQEVIPSWYPDVISIEKSSSVVILDDDVSLHNLWRHRLQKIGLRPFHFFKISDLLEWLSTNSELSSKAIFLVDYELREDSLNGLQILEKIITYKHRYLITSHAEELTIQKQCQSLGIWLIPKSLATEIEIELLRQSSE